MKIKVTKKHIAAGTVGDCSKCPIGLALLEMGHGWVRVDQDTVEVGTGYSYAAYHTTRKMADFIERFDDGKKVAPTEFTLGKPYAKCN